MRSLGFTILRICLVVLPFSGCADDTVENPFDTEGASGTATGTADDDGADEGNPTGSVDSTGSTSVTPPGTSSSDGGTSMGLDDSTTAAAESSSSSSSSSAGESSSSSTGEESSSSDGGTEDLPCPAGEFDTTTLPATVTGSSAGEDSEFGGTCGGGGAPDIAFLFTAPFDGDFIFDTFNSTFDTVLYVLDGECGGPQLNCNDDGIGTTTLSAVSVTLVAGQTVTVVVDAFGLAGGNVTLTAREGSIECPIDAGSTVPQTISGDTVIATNDFFGSCGTGESPDTEYLFTPLVDGTYTFEITANDFDTILYVLDGVCTGTEMVCNDNLFGAFTGESGLAVGLTANEPVTVVVDGAFNAFGTYDLTIGLLDGECPDADLGGMVPPFTVSGTTTGGDNATAGTCGGLGSNDFGYTWTAPFEASFRFDTTGSSFDTVVYVLDGSCTGTEMSCSNDTTLGTAGSTTAHLTAGQNVVIVVDGSAAEGDFDLTVDVECPAQDLGSIVPQVISDQTIVADDEFIASCGLGTAPDQGFTFTAPEDGTFTFETLNATFDTILTVLDGTCAGPELACNDNLDPTGVTGESGVAVGLAAGQTVTAVVDGSFGGTGTFDLQVGQLTGTCPDADLASMAPPFTVSGSTAGEDNASAGPCGGLGSPDFSYTWIAPFEASFRFDTTGSAYDTVVYVLDATCTGTPLTCSQDTNLGTAASATAHLFAGQAVVIVVDGNGAEGDFDLTVSVECPAADLGSTVPQTISGQTLVADDSFVASCGLGSGQDQGYTFTAPHDGVFTFETINNTFDTVMTILDGTCSGPELGCNDNLDPTIFTGESGLAVGLTAGQQVTIVIDGVFGATGNFDLVVGELTGSCPDDDLGNMAAPFTVMGTTLGEDNASAGTCGGLGSADFSYTWEVPATLVYRFDTAGSGYDTVVYLLDGSCVGPQINCSNDSGGTLQGNAFASLTAGQDVVIVVDGNGAEGAFTLSVSEAMDSGNCCDVHAVVGCDDPGVEACVCGIDSFCCNTSWDGICVDEAINICGAVCV